MELTPSFFPIKRNTTKLNLRNWNKFVNWKNKEMIKKLYTHFDKTYNVPSILWVTVYNDSKSTITISVQTANKPPPNTSEHDVLHKIQICYRNCKTRHFKANSCLCAWLLAVHSSLLCAQQVKVKWGQIRSMCAVLIGSLHSIQLPRSVLSS